MKFYGLKNCDSCRKAMKELDAASIACDYIDVRADGVPISTLQHWIDALGPDQLVNRRSTTWRGLSEQEKSAADSPSKLIRLLGENPTLIKRPVIEYNGSVYVGWTPATKSAAGIA